MAANKQPKTAGASGKNLETVGINVNLPQAVHRRLRVKAINEGKSLTEAVTAAVQQWVKAS